MAGFDGADTGRIAVERTFTWFPKLTRVMETLPPENVAEFAMAVAEYGTNAVEPAFASPLLAAVFEGVREDIDNSINARHRNKGGRPKKNPRENGGSEVSETQETPVSQNENQFSETETPVTENGNRSEEVSENENPSYINHTKPYQTIPSQTKAEKAKPKPPPKSDHPFVIQAIEIFNSVTGQEREVPTKDRTLERYILRVFNDGHSLDDVETVIRSKHAEWRNDQKMRKFIKPMTLFRPSKFDEYLQDATNRQEVTDSELDFYANRSQDEIVC